MLPAAYPIWGPTLEARASSLDPFTAASEVSPISDVHSVADEGSQYVVSALHESNHDGRHHHHHHDLLAESVCESSLDELPSIDESLFDLVDVPDLEEIDQAALSVVASRDESYPIPSACQLIFDDIPALEDVLDDDDVNWPSWTNQPSSSPAESPTTEGPAVVVVQHTTPLFTPIRESLPIAATSSPRPMVALCTSGDAGRNDDDSDNDNCGGRGSSSSNSNNNNNNSNNNNSNNNNNNNMSNSNSINNMNRNVSDRGDNNNNNGVSIVYSNQSTPQQIVEQIVNSSDVGSTVFVNDGDDDCIVLTGPEEEVYASVSPSSSPLSSSPCSTFGASLPTYVDSGIESTSPSSVYSVACSVGAASSIGDLRSPSPLLQSSPGSAMASSTDDLAPPLQKRRRSSQVSEASSFCSSTGGTSESPESPFVVFSTTLVDMGGFGTLADSPAMSSCASGTISDSDCHSVAAAGGGDEDVDYDGDDNNNANDSKRHAKTGSGGGGGRRSRFSPEDRKERKKAQNRTAANRYREKRRHAQETVSEEEQRLMKANGVLRLEATKLQAEVSCLRKLMRQMLQAKGIKIPPPPHGKNK